MTTALFTREREGYFENLRSTTEQFDEVWCAIDGDFGDKISNARATANGVKLAISTMWFEYGVLLHFVENDRASYQRAAKNENAPVQSPMNRGVPSTASPATPSAVGAGGFSLAAGGDPPTAYPNSTNSLCDGFFRHSAWAMARLPDSATTVTGSTVMAQVTISIANRDGTAISATGSIRLEFGELLIAICRQFHDSARRLQHFH